MGLLAPPADADDPGALKSLAVPFNQDREPVAGRGFVVDVPGYSLLWAPREASCVATREVVEQDLLGRHGSDGEHPGAEPPSHLGLHRVDQGRRRRLIGRPGGEPSGSF